MLRFAPALTLLLATLASPLTAQVPGLSGTLVITNKTPATATIIDVASGKTLATLPTGQGPHEVVMSRDGRVAVVTDYGSQAGGSTPRICRSMNGYPSSRIRSRRTPTARSRIARRGSG